MRFLRYISVIFLFSSFLLVTKQPDHVLAVKAEKMITDNLGNVYLINRESISKYDMNGVFQKSFSNKRYGAITTADATNPLRIVLYYRDFGRVIFLDNMLSQVGDDVKLETLGFPMATAVAASHDNGLWIFDQQNSELVRFNRNMQIENRSGNISQIVEASSPNVHNVNIHADFLIEKGSYLMMSDTANGIFVFDNYGTFSTWVGAWKLTSFQLNFGDDEITFLNDGMLFTYPLLRGDPKMYIEPYDTTAIDMRMEKNAIYVLKKDTLKIYNRINNE